MSSAVLITGGAGFIGTNLAHRLLDEGRDVIVYDNLSRPGVEENLRWLREVHGEKVCAEIADINDKAALSRALHHVEQVYHFAAQVAVTTSLSDPLHDFRVNAQGTLTLLEALRAMKRPPSLVFTSTNKVYGGLDDLPLATAATRYEVAQDSAYVHGVDERRPLDFHSPYGCSKGAADQYVRDYARSYGLKTVVFRMSCIYGPHQFGTEDQGWVAHFVKSALAGVPITLYGDGMQVRDVLFVEDLVDALRIAGKHAAALAGQAFNIGGSLNNAVSLIELIDLIGALHGAKPVVRFDAWRVGDQRYYISDIRKFKAATGWTPRTPPREGVRQLYEWLGAARQPTDHAIPAQGSAVK